jgi:polysaccharide biosynthesis transport protein
MSLASQSGRPESVGSWVDLQFDFPALGTALWRCKWRILAPTLLVAFATLAVVQLIPPKYLSESRVLIEEHGNVFLRPDIDKDAIDGNAANQETVASQVQLVLSRDLASAVIAKLRLGKRPEFDAALDTVSPKVVLGHLSLIRDPTQMTPEERVLEAYYDRLTAYAVDKSRVIVIDFQSQDPQLAANVANAIADEYLAEQRQVKQGQARLAAQWLAGEIKTMQEEVANAEAKVVAFRANSNLLEGPNNTTLLAQQLSDFNSQLATVRAQEVDAEAKAKIIRQMLSSGQLTPDILNSELISQLSEQRVTLRAELAEQSISFGEKYPRIKELKAQIADLDQQIWAEAATISRSFEDDARIAKARADLLRASFDQTKNQAAIADERGVELAALERDAMSKRDLLESYLATYSKATSRDTIDSSSADARVISRAAPSNVPAYPKKLASVLIAMMATMMLCCGFVLIEELLSVPGSLAEIRPPEPSSMGTALELSKPIFMPSRRLA